MKKNLYLWVMFSLTCFNSSRGWHSGRTKDKNAYLQKILDPHRLRIREQIFCEYSLPLLKEGIKKIENEVNVKVFLHASSLLPSSTKKFLERMQKDFDFLQISFFEPDFHYDYELVFKEFIKAQNFKEEQIVAFARLDDDDLLAPAYFELIKSYLKPEFVGFSFSAPFGYQGLFFEGEFKLFSHLNAPKLNIGLTHINLYDPKNDKFKSPYLTPPGSHNITEQLAPVILDGSEKGYIRTYHIYNDTNCLDNDEGYIRQSFSALKRSYFNEPIDEKEVFKNFSILKDKKCMPNTQNKAQVATINSLINETKRPTSIDPVEKLTTEKIKAQLSYRLGNALVLAFKQPANNKWGGGGSIFTDGLNLVS